jgi:protein-S-isoprenylcysteine O-methyltransferase Ste14
MNPFFTTIFLVFMVFMTAERLWETFFKKRGKRGEIVKKWTFPVLVVIHVIIGVGTIVEFFLTQRKINFSITLLGLTMFTLALIGRNWASNTLGEYHSVHIEIRDDHPLIREGPYRYVRHPYYLSVIFEFLGFPLVANAYYSFLISLFVYLPFLFMRVYFEEKAMVKKFGDEYIRYKSETRVFLPLPIKRSKEIG